MQNRHNPNIESSRADGDMPVCGDADAVPARRRPESTASGSEVPALPYGTVPPPQAFVLCLDGLDPEDYPDDGSIDPDHVVGWGATFDGDTMVRLCETVEHSLPSPFSSPESARRLFSRVFGPLRIVWACC